MFRFLSVLFLVGVVLELASIIWVGGIVGVIPTLLLLFGSAIIGVGLFRSAGANAAAVLRSSIQDHLIYESLAGTTMARIFSGLLFLTPGFFSDMLALLLLILPVSKWIGRKARISPGAGTRYPDEPIHYGPVIEGQAVEVRAEVNFEPPQKEQK